MSETFIKNIVDDVLSENMFIKDLTKSILDTNIEKAFGMPRMPSMGVKKDISAKAPSIGTGVHTHKYVKKEENYFGPGKHRYWYKMSDGSLVASSDEKGPTEKDKRQAPKREEKPSEELKKETTKIKDATSQLLTEVNDRLKNKGEGFAVGERKVGESQGQYELRQIDHALNYLQDFKEKFLKAPTATPEAEKMKREIYDNLIENIYDQLQSKSTTLKKINRPQDKQGLSEKQQPLTLQESKNKLNDLSAKGVSNLNSEEFKQYQKLKKDIGRQESAEIQELNETQEKKLQQERLNKSKDFVDNFEKITIPSDKIKKPVIDENFMKKIKQGENGPQNVNGPSKLGAQKLNIVNTLRSTFKQLKLHPKGRLSEDQLKKLVNIDKVLVGGASVSVSLNTPPTVSKNDIKKIADALQRKYGSDVNIKYKPGNVTEFEFAKRKLDDIIQPTLSTGIEAVNNELQSKTKQGKVRPTIINLGFDAKGQPINIDFSEGNSNSIAIVAGPGQGKSFSVESSLMQMTSIYSPEELQIDMIDTQGVFGSTLQKGAKKYISNEPAMGIKTKEDVKKVIDLLEANVQEIENRNQVLKKYNIDNWQNLPDKSGNRQFATKVVVFDEFNSAFDKINDAYAEDEQGAKIAKTLIQAKMKSIMNMGRKVGVVPITMGQMIDDNTKDIFTKAQAKVMYSTDASTARNFIGKGGTEASRNLVAKGQSVVEKQGSRTYGIAVRRSEQVNKNYIEEVGNR